MLMGKMFLNVFGNSRQLCSDCRDPNIKAKIEQENQKLCVMASLMMQLRSILDDAYTSPQNKRLSVK